MKKFLPYVLAVIVFIIAIVLLRPKPQVQALVAAGNMSSGHTITAGDVTLKPFDQENLPPDFISDPSTVVGQAVGVDRTQGDLILPSHLTSSPVILKPNERAMGVTVRDSSGLGGLLKPGDMVGVDAVITYQDNTTTGSYSKAAIEGMRVLYVSPSFKAEDPSQAAGTIVTPDASTGIAVQRSRATTGVVVVAVPTDLIGLQYAFSKVDPTVPDKVIPMNAIELLSALDGTDNAKLSIYLMPKGAQPFTTTGLYLQNLIQFPQPTPTPTLEATLKPGQLANTPMPTPTPKP